LTSMVRRGLIDQGKTKETVNPIKDEL